MIVEIKKSTACGSIVAPSSKSYAHRYIIASLLSEKENTLSHLTFSEDILATLHCCEVFGAHYRIVQDTVQMKPETSPTKNPVFDCHESGSTLRFFVPIALLRYKKVIFTGSTKLLQRGIEVYREIFANQSISILTQENQILITGSLQGGEFFVPGNISSQYISGLLFALPLLKEDSIIHLIPPLESYPYVEMTLDVLRKHHIEIQKRGNDLLIKGNQQYVVKPFSIEGDYSNAAFLDVYNYLNGKVHILNLNPDTLQGDQIYQEYFPLLKEKQATIDLSSCIDLGPVLFTFAAIHHGAVFEGTRRLALKESNRIVDLAEELKKIGTEIEIEDNKVVVHKSLLHPPVTDFFSHRDHRIVMALSMLCAFFPVRILQAEAVAKSYPDFFKDLKKIGIEVNELAES